VRITYRCKGTSFRQDNEPAGNHDVWQYLHVFSRHSRDELYTRAGVTLGHDRQQPWPSAVEPGTIQRVRAPLPRRTVIASLLVSGGCTTQATPVSCVLGCRGSRSAPRARS
jgi:hypothetical protein